MLEGLYWGYTVRFAHSFGAVFTQCPFEVSLVAWFSVALKWTRNPVHGLGHEVWSHGVLTIVLDVKLYHTICVRGFAPSVRNHL